MPAAVFLAAGALRHYLWARFPDDLQGMASKGLGALAILFLLAVVLGSSKAPKALVLVIAWWAWEECQVVLCSIAYMIEPWNVPPGVGICSAKTGLDIGALGILVVGYLAYYLVRTDSMQTKK